MRTSRAGVRVPSTSNRQMVFLISRSARGGYEAMAAVGGEEGGIRSGVFVVGGWKWEEKRKKVEGGRAQ